MEIRGHVYLWISYQHYVRLPYLLILTRRLRHFLKERGQQHKERVEFEIRVEAPAVHLYFGLKIIIQSVFAFSLYWWQKRIAFQSSFDLYFYIYTLKLLLMFLKEEGVSEVFPPGGNDLPEKRVCLGGEWS